MVTMLEPIYNRGNISQTQNSSNSCSKFFTITFKTRSLTDTLQPLFKLTKSVGVYQNIAFLLEIHFRVNN